MLLLFVADDAISPADVLDLADAAFAALGFETNDERARVKLCVHVC